MMTMDEALKKLDLLQKKMYAFDCANSSLYLDSVTVAPSDTADGRGVALGVLAGEQQKLLTDPEVGELLDFLIDHKDSLNDLQNRQVILLKRDFDYTRKIPKDEYIAAAVLVNDADHVWHKAKEASDFEMFRPYLEKIVEMEIRFAGYYDSEKEPYDALLDEYERGLNMAYLDDFFGQLKAGLVPLIHKIAEKQQVDDSFLNRQCPVESQRMFSDYLMEVLQLDRSHCTIGETEHPFTLHFNNKDVRITTHYLENRVDSSMYSVIHEGGHAKYELGIGDNLQYTCLASGASMSIHESQSRFYENIIGRSRAFISAIFPKMQELFPEQLKDVTAEQMYLAVNKAQPSLIRTEADELTYALHVMIRYEIEKQLINGSLAVKDVPDAWNRLYKEYLGVDVPDDRHGCLQDSHWAGGMIGYFPSYALGSAYGAQMLVNMEKDVDVWTQVAKGDLTEISEWLRDKIHQYGRLMEPQDIVRNACGEFDAKYYIEYLTNKYTEIYQLD